MTFQSLSRATLGFTFSLFAALPLMAQDSGSISTSAPSSTTSAIRIMPVVGASSFTNAAQATLKNFNDSFSAGVFADFGSGALDFETGVLTLQSHGSRNDNSAGVTVDTWGIPLLAKLNFSGLPHSTIFAKLGAMPFNATGDGNNVFNVMGVGGVGANIPLGRSSSILLDATYNRLFTNAGDLTNYQGFTLLAGLSFSI